MKMQGISWNKSYYVFPYERDTASEPEPDYREVIICQMDNRIEELKNCIGDLIVQYEIPVSDHLKILLAE